MSEPDGKRDAVGRFLAGNTIGRGRGWKAAIAKLVGRDVDDPVATAVAGDAWCIFSASIREMPSAGPTVRGLVAQKARHEALAGFWTAQAVAAGLATAGGIAAQEQATRHGQRAERLAVTALDVATRLAEAERRNPKAGELAPWFRPAPTPAQDEPTALEPTESATEERDAPPATERIEP